MKRCEETAEQPRGIQTSRRARLFRDARHLQGEMFSPRVSREENLAPAGGSGRCLE